MSKSRFPKCHVEFSRIVPGPEEVHLDHRCHRAQGHYGPHECRCGSRLAELGGTSFAPDGDGRIPAIRVRGAGQWLPLGHDTGLEVLLLEFGSQDGGWAWIQVREQEQPEGKP